MRIAVVCTMMKRFGRKGLYNSQEIGLGRALARMGHEVVIYKGVKDKNQVESVELEKGLTIHYLTLPHFGAHGYLTPGRIDAALDGMIVFSDQQIFIPFLYRFCQKHNIVFVPWVGTTFSLYVNSLRGRVMDFLFKSSTLRLYHHIPVFAKTATAREELIQLGVPGEQIVVTPVGIDTEVMKKDFENYDRAELRREYGLEADDVVLMNVGRLEPDKRPMKLLELFLRIRGKKKFRLLMIGEGFMKAELEEKIRQCGLEGEVKIFERVPNAEMWKIYRSADYYLNMSDVEIFGMAILEAVYYQRSVVAKEAMGPSLTLAGLKGHCLCKSDEEIERWIMGPYPSQEDLKESAEKMVEKFSWNHTARVFADFIQSRRQG